MSSNNYTLGEIADTVSDLALKRIGKRVGRWLFHLGLIWLAIQTVGGLYVGIVYPCEVLAIAGIEVERFRTCRTT